MLLAAYPLEDVERFLELTVGLVDCCLVLEPAGPGFQERQGVELTQIGLEEGIAWLRGKDNLYRSDSVSVLLVQDQNSDVSDDE